VQKAGRLYSILCDLQIGENPPRRFWKLAARRLRLVNKHLAANQFYRTLNLPQELKEKVQLQINEFRQAWSRMKECKLHLHNSDISERQQVCARILYFLDEIVTIFQVHPCPNPLSYT
jgi:hypothetical protein